jgi:hypothetical protein
MANRNEKQENTSTNKKNSEKNQQTNKERPVSRQTKKQGCLFTQSENNKQKKPFSFFLLFLFFAFHVNKTKK